MGVTPRAQTSRGACFICFEAPGNSVFMECGHAGACWVCANTIAHGHSKRQIMTRRAYNAMMAVGGTQARYITLQNVEEEEVCKEGGGGLHCSGPSTSSLGPPPPSVPAASPPLSSLERLNALKFSGGTVPWIKHRVVRLSPSQMETLGELGELRGRGDVSEEDFGECVDGAVRAALAEVEKRAALPFSLRPPAVKLGRPVREEMLLVTVLTGGSGVCPVCRSPVTNILRLGPDTTTTDGRTVALILPDDAYQWKQEKE